VLRIEHRHVEVEGANKAGSVIQPQAPSPERVLPVAVNAGSAPTWHWMDGWPGMGSGSSMAWPCAAIVMIRYSSTTIDFHKQHSQLLRTSTEYLLACCSSTRR
jgi:hypothetical protein